MSDTDDCQLCPDGDGLCPTHAEDRGYFRGRETERAAIVAWLRERAMDYTRTADHDPRAKWNYYAAAVWTAVDAIERGEHLMSAHNPANAAHNSAPSAECWRCKLPLDEERMCSASNFTLTCARGDK